MANSSFFKNTGTSTQLQGSASASAAAALASEQAALASENASATSETNAAASAAAALASKNAAASSAASANSDASAASISATASQTAATSSSANAALTSADATQTAADRIQTGLDRIATSADAVQTAADRVQTGLDVTSSSNSAAAALSSRNAAATSETNAAASAASSSADATATASDRVQTGLDAASTAADTIATAADRVQTGLDATSASNSASAANTSASAASASQIAAASSAASAAAVFSDFEDRYYGPHASDSAAQTHVTGLGLTVDQGDLYFNSTANEMRVYDGGSWVAASSAGGASLINYHYTATASQTAFSGSDDNSNTLSYTVDNLIVTKNGIVLEVGTDYTATNGTSIVLAVAAAAGDEINVVAFKSFTTADMVSATNGGTFQSNVTVNGTMTATAFSGDGSALTNLPVSTPTLTSLGIPNHDDITVDGSGNVGIGTASPAYPITAYRPTSVASYVVGENGSGVKTAIGVAGDNGSLLGTLTNHDLRIISAGAERMRIDSSGNVGIGTSSPTKKVSTSIGLSDTDGYVVEYSGDAKGGMLVSPTTGEVRMGAINSNGTYFTTLYANNSEAARIDLSGNLGIGNDNPQHKFHITHSGTGAIPTDYQIGATSPNDNYQGIHNNNNAATFSGLALETRTAAASRWLIANEWKSSYLGDLVFRNRNGGTTSQESLRIDSSGRVTMPYQPAFSVKNSAGTHSTDSIMVFNSDPVNIGNHYNTSTGLFTAPVAGTYLFSWQLLSYETANNYCYSALTINSTKLWYNQEYQNTGIDTGISSNGTVSVYLYANDTVGVFAFGGATQFYAGSGGNYTWFSGVLLG